MTTPLHIGFIPLVDAAALIVAVDKGFTAAEGLDVTLIREVSWSNIRDKLNIGLFDAAHMIAPIAIASSLGIGHAAHLTAASFASILRVRRNPAHNGGHVRGALARTHTRLRQLRR